MAKATIQGGFKGSKQLIWLNSHVGTPCEAGPSIDAPSWLEQLAPRRQLKLAGAEACACQLPVCCTEMKPCDANVEGWKNELWAAGHGSKPADR